MKIYIPIFFCLINMIFISCTKLDYNDYKNIKKDIIGIQIKFDNLQLNNFSNYYLKNALNNKKKIILIIDSSCSICIQNFRKWNTFFGQKDYKNIELIILFYGENFNTVNHYYNIMENPKFRIFLMNNILFIYDNNLFKYLNEFLLIDRNDKILAVGNPLQESQIDNIFRSIINN